ncbi:hypothetical protein GCM10009772_54950 [Pseudonocardia alni subsp. carboxydivorans]|uniref:Uncharacterized protein n=1 Tax=Pseudonocardia alni subsp. carboxydivorans TaxID=415010 RepID=A0ABU9AP84_PSEA5
MREYDLDELREAARERALNEELAVKRCKQFEEERRATIVRRSKEVQEFTDSVFARLVRIDAAPDRSFEFHRTEFSKVGVFRRKSISRIVEVSKHCGWAVLEMTATRYVEGSRQASYHATITYGMFLASTGQLKWFDVGGPISSSNDRHEFRESLDPERFGPRETYKIEPLGLVDLLLLQDNHPRLAPDCPPYLQRNPSPSIDSLIEGLVDLEQRYNL